MASPSTPTALTGAISEERLTTAKDTQSVLLLQGFQHRYELIEDYPIPELQSDDEVLIRNAVVGLNPIDWKAPDYNFGIPYFPYISGRELVGTVCKAHAASRLKYGDRVLAISTDYRDMRKAAYQEYVVSSSFNVVKLPTQLSSEQGASLGVAFITSALALGSSFGLSFADVLGGPDLPMVLENTDINLIPEDVRHEALSSLRDHERPVAGDWVAIWGGSATSAYLAMQIAQLAGLKVALLVDQARHGFWLATDSRVRPDLLIDNSDPARAVEVLKATLGNQLFYGIDTNGKESAGFLLSALEQVTSSRGSPSPPPTPPKRAPRRSHLIGLAGLPQSETAGAVQMHSVPLKLFHEVPEVGKALTEWMERLLHGGLLRAPRILGSHYGLGDINNALDRMRNGDIRGGKLVVAL